MDKVGLKTLISEVSNAICGIQIVMDKMQMENFFSYFESKENGVLSAISRRIELPYNECGKEKKTEIQVPIVSLMSHNPIALESVEVKIKADLCSYNNELMVSMGTYSCPNDERC